ncbi:MAG: SCO family protein [Bacteroidota bacterium]
MSTSKIYLPLAIPLFISLFIACGPSTLDPSEVPAHYRIHPFDEETQTFKLDELTYPGNQPTDPETGEIMPEPVRDWTYTDQMGRTLTNKDLLGKVYVADFFFGSCPTICPKVKQQQLRLQEAFADEPDFRMISFTVDPKRDTIARLFDYADRLGVTDHDRWRFLRGDKLFTYEMDEDYLSIAEENPDAPGGFDHTGYLVLVDRKGMVRAYANGTDPEAVTHFIDDVKILF